MDIRKKKTAADRKLTVSGLYDQRNMKTRPYIRISGDWLERLGFEIGGKINVKCMDGKLIITPEEAI